MWTKAFWRGAAERMIRGFTAAFLATLSIPNVADGVGFDVRNVGWESAAAYGAGAAIVSLAFSLLANTTNTGPAGSASLVYDRPKDVGVSTPDGS